MTIARRNHFTSIKSNMANRKKLITMNQPQAAASDNIKVTVKHTNRARSNTEKDKYQTFADVFGFWVEDCLGSVWFGLVCCEAILYLIATKSAQIKYIKLQIGKRNEQKTKWKLPCSCLVIFHRGNFVSTSVKQYVPNSPAQILVPPPCTTHKQNARQIHGTFDPHFYLLNIFIYDKIDVNGHGSLLTVCTLYTN